MTSPFFPGCNRESKRGYSLHAGSPSEPSKFAEIAGVYGDGGARAGRWDRLDQQHLQPIGRGDVTAVAIS